MKGIENQNQNLCLIFTATVTIYISGSYVFVTVLALIVWCTYTIWYVLVCVFTRRIRCYLAKKGHYSFAASQTHHQLLLRLRLKTGDQSLYSYRVNYNAQSGNVKACWFWCRDEHANRENITHRPWNRTRLPVPSILYCSE